MSELDILVIVLGIVSFALASAGGTYIAIKRFLINLADALEDDVITKKEFEQLVKDAFNIINIVKYIFRR